MQNKVEIYQSKDKQIQLQVQLEKETVWLNRQQLSTLFDRDIKTIGKHIGKVFLEGELEKKSVVANFATTAADGKTYQVEHYNLDVIISVGYRVKSQRGTQFRIWATQRLKDYLVQGYAINEKRLSQKQEEVKYLKTGIRILSRAMEQEIVDSGNEMLRVYAKGLELLDDYDHEELDTKGKTLTETIYPQFKEYMDLIQQMYSDFESDVFASPKDDSFQSSINQIKQTFDGKELYPTIEEKAANLLYFITKNHSFVDGNKRIAAACFLFFLQQNGALINANGEQIISNEALASLTLFIASSKAEESEIIRRLVISILNRNK